MSYDRDRSESTDERPIHVHHDSPLWVRLGALGVVLTLSLLIWSVSYQPIQVETVREVGTKVDALSERVDALAAEVRAAKVTAEANRQPKGPTHARPEAQGRPVDGDHAPLW